MSLNSDKKINTLRRKNKTAVLSFVAFCLISLVSLPFYHIHTDIEHVWYSEPHKHQAHQHICLIESLVLQISGVSIDEDCDASHKEEETQTSKSQYLIKQGEGFKKGLSLLQDFTLKIQNPKSEIQNSNYFLQINFIHSDYNFSPFCNNFSTRSPPQILI